MINKFVWILRTIYMKTNNTPRYTFCRILIFEKKTGAFRLSAFIPTWDGIPTFYFVYDSIKTPGKIHTSINTENTQHASRLQSNRIFSSIRIYRTYTLTLRIMFNRKNRKNTHPSAFLSNRVWIVCVLFYFLNLQTILVQVMESNA